MCLYFCTRLIKTDSHYLQPPHKVHVVSLFLFVQVFAFSINLLTYSRSLRLLSGTFRSFMILYSASYNLFKFFIMSFTSFSLSKDTSSGLFVVASSFFFPSRTEFVAVLFPISTDARNVSISCLYSTFLLFLLCPSWWVISGDL